MKVTIIGSANPCPQVERAGISMAVSVGAETLVVDCGPWASYRLVENEIDVAEIRRVFFTHHHMDHNVSFFHFALAGWYLGRDELTVYGPEPGTSDLVDGFHTAFQTHFDDVERWREGPETGLTDVDVVETTEDLQVRGEGWRVTAFPVKHSIPTYAYRVEETATGASFVYSGDTRKYPPLGDFAAEADVLVHDCNLNGEFESPLDADEVSPRYSKSPFADYLEWVFRESTQQSIEDMHTTPAGAGEIAAEADVETLVLTHLNPLRDTKSIREEAKTTFDGDVVVARDGLTLTTETPEKNHDVRN